MAERINTRSHNKLQEWGLKGAAIIALGAAGLGLVGCGNEKANADHTPPAASAPATPGSSESSPAPSESVSTSPENGVSPEMSETVLTKSEVYNNMSPADQAMVEKDKNLSLKDFEKLPVDERAMVSLVLSDAQHAPWVEAVGPIVMPGNQGHPLKAMPTLYLDQATGKYSHKDADRAQAMYEYSVVNDTPKDIDTWTNFQPYFGVQIRRAIAASEAATGIPSLLKDAEKIVAGTVYDTDDTSDSTHGNLDSRISELEKMSATKTNTLKYLGYPDAATYKHFLANEMSGTWVGHPGTVSVAFEEVDPSNPINVVPGLNSDGATGAVYHHSEYTDKNGHSKVVWYESETSAQPDALGLGVFETNTMPPESK